MNRIEEGYKIIYLPVRENSQEKSGEIALVVAPADRSELVVLEPRKASTGAEWTVPKRISTLAVVWGPKGLSEGRVQQLVRKDQEIIEQLAEYAQKTSDTEHLLAALSQRDDPDMSRHLDAALTGFASSFGAAAKIDRSAPLELQTLRLIKALNPALAAYDPLTPQAGARTLQSAVLAAAVGSLFLGNGFGLAASGAGVAVNLRTLFFPRTEFRSALAQSLASQEIGLCAKREAPSRTRLAYLWAARIPDTGPPAISIGAVHAAAGLKSLLALKGAPDWRKLERVSEWRLRPAAGEERNVPVKVLRDKGLELDLGSISPGSYVLEGGWDWDTFRAGGELMVHAPGNLDLVKTDPLSQDRVVTGSGPVDLVLAGTDFQFIEKALLGGKAVPMKLESGPRGGEQRTMSVTLDTAALKPGPYSLTLVQQDGQQRAVPFQVLPPLPVLAGLPLRLNVGDDTRELRLKGSGLGRLEGLSAPGVVFTLGPASRDDERTVTVKLVETAAGAKSPLSMRVCGMNAPVVLADAVEMAPARPRIERTGTSAPEDLRVSLRAGELPARQQVNLSLRIRDAGSAPWLLLQCSEPVLAIETRRFRGADLRVSAPGELFVSFDPGSAGQSGCNLEAILEAGHGRSDAKPVGRVVLLPRIDSFQLSEEKAGDGLFFGSITGRDLETIERVGWEPAAGQAVDTLPRPLAGDPGRQALRIVLPWPAPSPHAPLFVWLRGDAEGRATAVRF